MRSVEEDLRLGIGRVTWRFPNEDNTFSEPLQEAILPADDRSFVIEDESASEVATEAQHEESVEEFMNSSKVEHQTAEFGVLAATERHLEDMQAQIEFMKRIIDEQNRQLQTKDELIRNFQVLLKTEQDQVLKLETTLESASTKRSFWSMFWNRS